MVKKLISFILVTIFSLTMSNVFAADIAFPDLTETHWAYKYVSVLVNDGTVKGNDQGFFEPNKMVSRAEFVKMVGKGTTMREMDFADVPKSHWGYDYIMTSGLSGDENNNFNPSVPMTRGQTIELLWTRAGKPEDIVAPSIITNQAENKDAVSWLYMYGVMVGSDGVNLRLNDPISRAEAATLIVRARGINANSPKINFVDTVSPLLLEMAYKSSNIFDVPYDPGKTITNGEMARAAVRLASEEFNLTYRKFSIVVPFENAYAKDLTIIGKSIGQDKVNEGFVSQNANNLDALTAFSYAAIIKSHAHVSYGFVDEYYTDVPPLQKNLTNTVLTFAYKNGVQLYSDGLVKPNETVTLKSIAAILLQLDDRIGLQSVVTTDVDKEGVSLAYDMKQEKKLDIYPANWQQFACILSGLPTEVYSTNFEGMTTLDGSYGQTPAATYNFAREYSSMFMDLLKQYKGYLKQKHGIEVRFTYIPSLVCDNEKGYTLRVKCEVVSLNGNSFVYQHAFAGAKTAGIQDSLYDGMTFYTDITTDYTMGTGEGASFGIGKIIYKEK